MCVCVCVFLWTCAHMRVDFRHSIEIQNVATVVEQT